MYRGWTQTDYQNKHYDINQKDEETQDYRGRDGGTKFILRIKEQETRLTHQEHDDDDDDNDDEVGRVLLSDLSCAVNAKHISQSVNTRLIQCIIGSDLKNCSNDPRIQN